MAGIEAKETKIERCAIFSGAVNEEERTEVEEEKPGGEEMKAVENRGEGEGRPLVPECVSPHEPPGGRPARNGH